MLNPRALEAFRAIVTTGSTKGAAALLHVSQPGISRLLRSLEDDLAYALFTRVGGRLAITREGEALFEAVDLYSAGLRHLERVAREIGARRHKRLGIACLPAIGLKFLPELLGGLARPPAGPLFALSIVRSQTIPKLLGSGQCDLGIVSEANVEPGLRIVRAFSLDCLAILPRHHPLAASDVLTWEALARYPYVGLHDGAIIGRRTAAAFAERRIAPRLCMETHLTLAVSGAVGSGMGVSVVDPFTAREHERGGGVVRPLRDPVAFGFMLVRPLNAGTSEHQTRFIRAFSGKVGALAAGLAAWRGQAAGRNRAGPNGASGLFPEPARMASTNRPAWTGARVTPE